MPRPTDRAELSKWIDEKIADHEAAVEVFKELYIEDHVHDAAEVLMPALRKAKGGRRDFVAEHGLPGLIALGMLHREHCAEAKVDQTQKLGEFECKSGTLYVTDPFCSGGGPKVEVPKGKWSACMVNRVGWGIRSFGIMATQDDSIQIPITEKQLTGWEEIGFVNVDAGCAGIFDGRSRGRRFCEVEDDDADLGDSGKVTDRGFFTGSGYGDGGYTVYVQKRDGIVVALWVDFYGVDKTEKVEEEIDDEDAEDAE